MTTFRALWQKLARSKKYREHFVVAQAKRGIPFQIRALMKQQELSQKELALRSGLTQGVVSRAANPAYGNLTLNTILKVAAGLDVAFIGRFVPFSELARWADTISEDITISTFPEEDRLYGDSAEIASGNVESDSTSRSARLIEVRPPPVKMSLKVASSRDDRYAAV